MAAKKKLKSKSKGIKKKWFLVKAPEVYNSKEIGEITAYKSNNIIGRGIKISMKEITGNVKDHTSNAYLKITKVQGETAFTDIIKLNLSENYVQRVSKRSKERVLIVDNFQSKDKIKIKFKVYLLIANKLPRSLKTEIQKKGKEIIKYLVSKQEADKLFTMDFSRKLGFELRKHIKPIYPIARAFVWKISKIHDLEQLKKRV